MQSFILGAGLGSRLAPLSLILPKPLMPIFQKPLVQHIMDRHYEAGVRSFIVNISQHDYLWERAFPKETYRDCPVVLSHEESALDSGGGIKKILPLINLDEPLIIHNGDILSDIPVAELLQKHQQSGNLITLALRSCDGKRNVGFDPQSGQIIDIRHALGIDTGSYQFTGIYIINPSIAELFPKEDHFSIVPIWIELIRQGKVGGVVYDWPNWHEIGNPEQYLEAILELNSRERIHSSAQIHPSSKICDESVIGKDSHIPADTRLTDCIVWPRSHVEPGTHRRCIITPRITVQL